MNRKKLPFRQVHLDFHTSPVITGIGRQFDKAHWQRTLKEARVNSITLFSKCHHGWSYHPTKVGKVHPHLDFNLLRLQYDACKEIGIQAPVYLSAGVDNLAAYEHPEWRQIIAEGQYQGVGEKPPRGRLSYAGLFQSLSGLPLRPDPRGRRTLSGL